jgi:hypothetical protein
VTFYRNRGYRAGAPGRPPGPPALTEAQKEALLGVYRSFVTEAK